MLDKEDNVKKHRQHGKQKLNDVEALVGVSEEWLALEDGLDGRLHEREEPAAKVENDVGEAPADSRLTLIVQVDLGHVLDQGNCRLHVAGHSNCSILLVDLGLEDLGDEEGDHHHRNEDQEGNNPQIERCLLTAIIHEDLRQLHGGKRKRVNAEDDVVDLDSTRLANYWRDQAL